MEEKLIVARGNRLHIGFFGRCNSGKSTLLNTITGQDVSLTSEIAGTTTDVVYKPMEIHGLGACVFIDTAGFDDDSVLGVKRLEKTKKVAQEVDMALLLFSDAPIKEELDFLAYFRKRNIPVLAILTKCDTFVHQVEKKRHNIEEQTGLTPILTTYSLHDFSAKNREQLIEKIRLALLDILPKANKEKTILGNLLEQGDIALLVMPQDVAAPKGRLILPQVETIREILDRKCTAISTVPENLERTLQALKKPPKLIITDSQVFSEVYAKTPNTTKITSFSILFATLKGDSDFFLASAKLLPTLKKNAKILIAEACTHKPLNEDIGRVKLPRLLKKHLGDSIHITVTSGKDFPSNLQAYDFIIHCGACMFPRSYVLERVRLAKEVGVPMSNYGMVIASFTGILDKVVFPTT